MEQSQPSDSASQMLLMAPQDTAGRWGDNARKSINEFMNFSYTVFISLWQSYQPVLGLRCVAFNATTTSSTVGTRVNWAQDLGVVAQFVDESLQLNSPDQLWSVERKHFPSFFPMHGITSEFFKCRCKHIFLASWRNIMLFCCGVREICDRFPARKVGNPADLPVTFRLLK